MEGDSRHWGRVQRTTRPTTKRVDVLPYWGPPTTPLSTFRPCHGPCVIDRLPTKGDTDRLATVSRVLDLITV